MQVLKLFQVGIVVHVFVDQRVCGKKYVTISSVHRWDTHLHWKKPVLVVQMYFFTRSILVQMPFLFPFQLYLPSSFRVSFLQDKMLDSGHYLFIMKN